MAADRALVIPASDASTQLDAEALDTFPTARMLWRRKTLIICVSIALTVVMAMIISQLTPTYSAKTYIMIEPGDTEIVDAVAAVMVGGSADAETIQSEVRALQSRTLAERVITELRLSNDPEFNTSLAPPGMLDSFLAPLKTVASDAASQVDSWIEQAFGGVGEELPNGDQDPAMAQRTRVIDRFLSHLNVSVDGLSRVIVVTFESESPETAASAANTLAELYIVSKLERKFEAAKAASQWINERVTDLRDRVEMAEAAAEQYRAQNDLIASNDVKLSTQEATELSAQLALARSQRAEAEARLRELELAVGGQDAVSEVLKSGVVAMLRAQEAEVERKVADLAQYGGENYPELIRARAELSQVKSQIRIEIQKVASALSNDLVAAQAREESLSESLAKLKTEASDQNQVEVKLRALEREAAASRSMLETFLLRAQETGSQESFQNADAHIVSKADVPQGPAYPKTNTLLLASMLGSLTVGVLLAFVVEMMGRGFRSEEQIEKILGASSLGLIPAVKRGWGRRDRLSIDVMKKPASAYAESIRNLYTGIRLSNGEEPPRVILIASSLPKEGKTTVVVSLAALLSSTGMKTIIIDTDMRKPTVHRVLQIAPGPGLAEYLTEQLTLEEIIQKESASGMSVITAGSHAISPPNLLGTDRMKELLQRLKSSYDVIILDSAPVLAVSDTRVLVRAVDRTVFLIRWEDTRRDVAKRGLQQIREAEGKVAGIMLTMVDFERYAKYRYGAFGHYYHRVEEYYRA
jgi:polysaccharide biosynthesis transport protein